MSGFGALFKRELFSFFVTPLAWILIVVFLILQGLHFALLVDHFSSAVDVAPGQSPLQAFFGSTVLLYLILFLLVPAMTMRLFAEERRSGTIEPLMTAPVTPIAVALAKYSAALVTYVVMWAPTVLYVVILGRAEAVDWHVIAASYFGIFLMGGGYIAIGLLMSAATRSQFLAFILTALVVLALFIIGIGEFVIPGGPLHDLCAYVSVWAQMNDFAAGIVDSKRIVFDITLVALPLFLTVQLFSRKRSAAIGASAALAIAVFVNILAARHYKRWDVTETGRYTLTDVTRSTLRGLDEPIDVWVLLGAGDPMRERVRQTLIGYSAESPQLSVHMIDPDRDAAAFEDLRRRFNLETGRTEQGTQVADAIAIVSSGDKRWYLTPTDFVEVGDSGDRAALQEERAFTTAIRNVIAGERAKLCFVTGHGEMRIRGEGRTLEALRTLLEKSNYDPIEVDTSLPNAMFETCAAVVVASPRAGFSAAEATLLKRYLDGGGGLFAAIGLLEGANVGAGSLAEVFASFGIAIDNRLIFELDPARKIPETHGSRFIADAKAHPLTAALAKREGSDVPRAIVQLAQPMLRVSGHSTPVDLLTTSRQAIAKSLPTGDGAPLSFEPSQGDQAGPFVIAMASERAATNDATRGARVVASSTGGLFEPRNWNEPSSARGAAFFVEGAISWVAKRPPVLDIPARSSLAAGLRISDESRVAIQRYVLVYMPVAAILLAIAVALRRRNTRARH